MDILIILFLVLLNGIFSLSEMALVSSRKSRLQQWSDEGKGGATIALSLSRDPGYFLSTIQVGITLIGILSGAYGETAFAGKFAAYLGQFSPVEPFADAIALTTVVIVITYLSLIIGELVPKQLALRDPERVATLVARPLHLLSSMMRPLVYFINWSSERSLKLLGVGSAKEQPVTEEEINVLMEHGAEAGVFEKTEQALVANILRLDQQRLESIMTRRDDLAFLDVEDEFEKNRLKLTSNKHARLPVCKGGLENVLGILATKDLLGRSLAGESLDFFSVLRHPLFVPESISTMELLETFKSARNHLALVVDEYGKIQGLVTLNDVLEAIVGDIPSYESAEDSAMVRREDGSWLVDGALPVYKFKNTFALNELPEEELGNFQTMGGFVMMFLGRIPNVSDHFEAGGLRFEVVDMDKNRVDKILVLDERSGADGAAKPVG
ncbi:MAG TPA: hemolysin family protein [Azonexus sp.]|jgi:putative hemolysin|nr:hemolysin family protein [Azonexus sp.]